MMERVYHYRGSRDEARKRVDQAMAQQAERYPRFRPLYRWEDPYRAFAHFHIPLFRRDQVVELIVHPDRIVVRSKLPRLFKVFLPRILEVLDRHARVALDGMLCGAA